MGPIRTRREVIAVFLSFLLGVAPARALVNIQEGRDRIFVSSTFNMGYDSNLFASSNGGGDYVYSLDLSTQFVRHAGLIGIDSSIGVNATRYGKYRAENFQNPRFHTEFSKQIGRTTGSLSLNASRQSRADTAANLRNESWSYDASLNTTYQVLQGRYSVASSLGYSMRDFKDNTVLFDLKSYTAGAELYYLLPGDSRSLLVGYRYRIEKPSAIDRNTDNSFTLGLSGRLIWLINGALRVGYEVRKSTGATQSTYGAWTMSGTSTIAISKRLNITGQVGKDFSTTSTNISVDSLSSALSASYSWNTRTSFSAGTGLGLTRFLGSGGLGRRDTNWSWNLGASRIVSTRLKVALSYSYSKNWSNMAFSTFGRRAANFTATSEF